MLYNVNVDEWGTTYVPTALGNALIVVAIVAMLLIASIVAKKQSEITKKKFSVKQLVFCAMAIALGTVLSELKLVSFPYGGSITILSMLIICLPGYWFGLSAGLMTACAYGTLQILFDPYIIHPIQMLLDYTLAFGALGLSGVFANSRNGLIKGYILGTFGRYVCSTISGYVFFAEYAWEGWGAFAYSVVYNAIVIYPEVIVTIIILLIPAMKKAMVTGKNMALN